MKKLVKVGFIVSLIYAVLMILTVFILSAVKGLHYESKLIDLAGRIWIIELFTYAAILCIHYRKDISTELKNIYKAL